MATIYVRARTLSDGQRRFDVRYRRGGRYTAVEHGGTFRTMREAKARQSLVSELLAAGLNPKAELRRRLEPGSPLGVAAAGWSDARRAVKTSTRENYRWREAVVLDRFGDTPLDEILVEDVIAWVAALERSYKPGSVRALMEVLRLMLDHVGGLNVARDRRIHLPRTERRQLTPPDAEKVVAMLSALPNQHVPTAITMELLGTRVSETLAIERRDLLDDAVRIRAETTKTSRSRLVPAPQFLVDALMERVMSQSRQAVGNAMRRAGSVHPHALRHRRATLWYQAGVGPVELAQRLGHSRASMSLDTYAHVEPLDEIPHQTLAAFFK